MAREPRRQRYRRSHMEKAVGLPTSFAKQRERPASLIFPPLMAGGAVCLPVRNFVRKTPFPPWWRGLGFATSGVTGRRMFEPPKLRREMEFFAQKETKRKRCDHQASFRLPAKRGELKTSPRSPEGGFLVLAFPAERLFGSLRLAL